jgi:hypothetical protein
MKWIILLTLTFSISAFAKSVLSYQVDGKKIEMLEFPERKLTLSKSCSGKKDILNCKAYQAFQQASKLQSKLESPPEIATDLCRQTGGVMVMGLSDKKDERPFCYFKKDSSFVDMGSLYASQQGFGK